MEPIATPTKTEPTSVPVVPAPPVAARAMVAVVAVVAVAASEPVVVAKPQPYEQLLAIQREIAVLQRQAQAIRTRDLAKTIDSLRETMRAYGIRAKDLRV